MTGAAIGLFASLCRSALIKGGGQFFAGIVSFVSMLLISSTPAIIPRLQNALGIAMLIGMFAAAYFF